MEVLIIFWLMTVADGVCGLTGRGLMYPGRSDFFELSILHINDFHARFEEVGPTAGTCHRDTGKTCVGGIARLYTAIHEILRERPDAIFLNAGDHYQGTLWYNVHRWNATAIFMNMLPHDAMTIGNHEFDDKITGLVPFLKAVTAPVVVCNIDFRHEPSMQNLTTNSTIIYRNGKKIGVIGVIIRSTPDLSSTEKLIFLDEIESVNFEAEKLKKDEKVDIIIVLSHCGLDLDRKMAEKCPLVDVIIGGHSHTFLYSGDAPFIDQPADEYPVVVTQASKRTVLIVQAAAFTKYLGNLTVWFDEKGEVADWDGNPILLDDTIPEDPTILRALAPWKAAVDVYGSKVVGTTRVKLQKDCRIQECNLGNLITDAMVDSWVSRADNDADWTYAAISVMNAGGIRTSIDSGTGNITFGDLVMVQPFTNTWDVVELLGRDIKQTLEVSVSSAEAGRWQGQSALVWAGLRVTFNMSRPSYNRVSHVSVRCRTCDVPVYQPLVHDQWYRIVVNSFLLAGGDRHRVIAENHRNHVPGMVDLDLMMKFLEKVSPIFYGKEGRIIVDT